MGELLERGLRVQLRNFTDSSSRQFSKGRNAVAFLTSSQNGRTIPESLHPAIILGILHPDKESPSIASDSCAGHARSYLALPTYWGRYCMYICSPIFTTHTQAIAPVNYGADIASSYVG